MSAPRSIGPVTAAATAGGGTGYALALIVVWLITLTGAEVPAPVGDAIGLILSLGLSLIGGWLVPSKRGEHAG